MTRYQFLTGGVEERHEAALRAEGAADEREWILEALRAETDRISDAGTSTGVLVGMDTAIEFLESLPAGAQTKPGGAGRMTRGKIISVNDNLGKAAYFLHGQEQGRQSVKRFETGQVGGSAGYVDTVIGHMWDGTVREWPRWMVEVITEPVGSEAP